MGQKFFALFFFVIIAVGLQAQPIASFTARGDTNATTVRVCRGYPVNFKNLSTADTSRTWIFSSGNPSTSTANNVTVSWAANGTYSCSLTAYGTGGLTDVINFNVIVTNNTPNVTFGPIAQMCSSDPGTLLTTGNPAGGKYFGIAVSNNRFFPGLAGVGTHTVGYVYTALNGCNDTAFSSVTVIQGPNASLLELNNFSNCNGFTTATPNFLIDLFNTSTSVDSIVHYEIIWGDGTPNWDSAFYRAPSISHTYVGQGVYQFQFIITSTNGCTDTAKYNVVNTSNPASLNMVNPGGTNGCAPVTVTFPISTTNTDTTITYTIQWGDGKDTTFKHPPPAFITHTYDTTSCILPGGFFNIKTIAKNACVNTQTILQGPFVTQPGKADFAPANGCVGVPLSINNMSIPGFTNACSRLSTYIWDFGDGSPLVTQVANTPLPPPGVHTYMAAGIYRVELILVSIGAACPGDTIAYNVCIEVPATAAATVTNVNGCLPFSPIISNTTDTVSACTNKQTGWIITPNTGYTLAPGSSLSDFAPNITFNTPGSYSMAFYNINNCGGDTLVTNVIVRGVPTVQLPQNNLDYCDTAFVFTASNPKHLPTILANGAAVTSYLWRIVPNTAVFVNGTDSTSQFPEFILVPGTYTITLFATNACGTGSATQTFTVNQVTYGGFLMNTTNGCSPLNVTLNSTSNPLVSHTWSINSVVYSTAVDTSVILTNTGIVDSIYQIKLVVYSGPGCQDTLIDYVTVRPSPRANFGATTVCLDQATVFTDSSLASVAPINIWTWDFGDGNTSNLQNPSYIYGSPGHYAVTLTVTDTNGCSGVHTDSVWVRSFPLTSFSLNYASFPDSICIQDSVFFIDATTIDANGTALTTWKWDVFNNGTIDGFNQAFTYVFQNPGSFPVKLVVTNASGCKDSIVQMVHVSRPPKPGYSLSTYGGCTPVSVIVSDTSSGYILNYNWSFYTLDSNQNRVLEYTTTSQNPNPVPPFQANIRSNKTVFVELTASNTCYTSVFTDTINIKPIPIPFFAFSADTGCSPVTVNIQVDGLATGNPDSIVFNFGDGSNSFVLFPLINILPNGDTLFTWNQQSHTFIYNGLRLDTTYYVTLWASNECGDSSYTSPMVVRNRSVQSFFTPNTNVACAPKTVSFTDFSFNATAVSYCFDFDTIANICNGPTAFGRNVTHTFTQPGRYVVAQFTSNWCGADTIFQIIEITPRPNVQVVFPASTCLYDTIFFQNNTTVSLGNILGYIWSFGDGDSANIASPSHLYAAPGTYQVCLKVFTDSGCDTTYCSNIIIYAKPTADFDFVNNVCLNEQPNQFLNLSSNPTGNISSYEWFFGDGNVSVQINPLHSYALAGTYTVKLRITNDDGCKDSVSKSITIYPIPDAAYTYAIQGSDSCGVPQIVQFTNFSNNAGGYYWDFNFLGNPGQDTSVLQHPNHTYTVEGNYTVMLIAKNGLGCSDTIFHIIRIHPFPIPDFLPDATAGCAPFRVSFNNLTALPPGFNDSISYTWNFGDGTSSKLKFPVHTYTKPGIYTVSLSARTIFGCEDSLTYRAIISVFEVPNVDFTYKLVEFDLYQFTSIASGGTLPYTFFWNFGDGGTSIDPNPLHRFRIEPYLWTYGYPVCLTITDVNGCDSTICDTINLEAFTLYVPNAMVPDGSGEASLFLPKGQGLDTYSLKIFDRWGNILWQTEKLDPIMSSPVEGWDGTYKGKPVPPGVYVWRIDAKFANGVNWDKGDENFSNSGTITILR